LTLLINQDTEHIMFIGVHRYSTINFLILFYYILVLTRIFVLFSTKSITPHSVNTIGGASSKNSQNNDNIILIVCAIYDEKNKKHFSLNRERRNHGAVCPPVMSVRRRNTVWPTVFVDHYLHTNLNLGARNVAVGRKWENSYIYTTVSMVLIRFDASRLRRRLHIDNFAINILYKYILCSYVKLYIIPNYIE